MRNKTGDLKEFLIGLVHKSKRKSGGRIPLQFIQNKVCSGAIKYLEAGAGLGEFLQLVRERFPGLQIKAVDISRELVEKLKTDGFDADVASITDMPFADEVFDITHCSHVIEHLAYPQIASALDELIRVTRIGGHLIIRTPLMNPQFYSDIDHVRPYPPEAILAHFEKEQLQRQSTHSIKVVKIQFEYLPTIVFKYRRHFALRMIRGLFILAWSVLGWPRSGPENYTIILERIT